MYDFDGIHKEDYWKLKAVQYTENIAVTAEHVRYLLKEDVRVFVQTLGVNPLHNFCL